ncbi:long-chain fatty acid--CoA ligase [Flavobacterium sp. RSP46]|uniref:class I adenylate-forming enzyme family protein n=1 Tax=Flavobacterium sp. RSP46 TaxID=2497486 RepID=UPI000F899C2E|nr:class I adenylate-forming enzyme family protein [Flavobacterium sp. RSP46]RTY89764.1 long-chain fatty acid--CoA ligase [Flavobacterium sp. RSP46]
MNTLDWIAKWADYTPDKIAITSYDTDEKYTYKEIDDYANNLLHKFKEYQVEVGDRIAVLAEHGLHYIVLLSACQRLGAIMVPLNYRLSSVEISKLLRDCSPTLLIFNSNQFEKMEEEILESYQTISVEEFKKEYKTKNNWAPVFYEIKEESPLFVFYTSGTIGQPKGVIYTNKMMFWNSLNTSMQLGITFNDSTINMLPPYHTSGWNVFVTPLLHKGAHIGMIEKFDPKKILFLLERYQTTIFIALPTMLQMMQEIPEFKKVDLKKIRYIISGGEMVNSDLVSHWKNTKNIAIRPGYGLTEAGPSVTSLHHNMALLKPNSIGKPNFYLDLKIINSNGDPVLENQIGEICLKVPIVTPGYWNNSIETTNKIKADWLYTGDLAYKDSEGYLYLKGRKDDMYISGGENIYPQEIELVLEKHKNINKAVVLSIKDNKWGACGIAFLTIHNADLAVDEIRMYLKKNIADYKQPKYIFILEEIPLTSLGKVSRKNLYNYFNSLSLER